MPHPHCATTDMGNKLSKHIGNSPLMVMDAMGGGKRRQRRAMSMQETKRDGPKGNQPTIFVFRDSYQLSDQCLTYKDEFSTPLDLSIGPHPSHFGQRRVLDITKVFRVRPRRWHIQTSWWDLAKRLVRAPQVIQRTEAVAPCLLTLRGGCWWIHNFLLESTVQPFMPSVLLRVSWLDAFGHNTQFDPPHRER